MSKVNRASPARRERLEAARREAERKDRRVRAALVGLAAAVLATIAVGTWWGIKQSSADRVTANQIVGLQSVGDLTQNHVDGSVEYPLTPPVGGDHDAQWQNCGVYSDPVANENAVHSLEHGAVWITYRPDLPDEQVAELAAVATGEAYLLVSPSTDLPAPVVASAWGKQLLLTGVADPRLDQFIRAFENGPQTPEPGAACSGGVGDPN